MAGRGRRRWGDLTGVGSGEDGAPCDPWTSPRSSSRSSCGTTTWRGSSSSPSTGCSRWCTSRSYRDAPRWPSSSFACSSSPWRSSATAWCSTWWPAAKPWGLSPTSSSAPWRSATSSSPSSVSPSPCCRTSPPTGSAVGAGAGAGSPGLLRAQWPLEGGGQETDDEAQWWGSLWGTPVPVRPRLWGTAGSLLCCRPPPACEGPQFPAAPPVRDSRLPPSLPPSRPAVRDPERCGVSSRWAPGSLSHWGRSSAEEEGAAALPEDSLAELFVLKLFGENLKSLLSLVAFRRS